MKDLGQLRYFLGMEVAKSKKGIVVSQLKYILDLLKETGMSGCKPSDTLIEANSRLGEVKNSVSVDTGRYQSFPSYCMQTRRIGSRDLISIDLEIEATVRKQGSKRRSNKNKQQETMVEPPATKPLWKYGVPDATTATMSSIFRPAVTRSVTLLSLIMSVMMQLDFAFFLFSLRDRAKEWLKDEGIGTFDSWDKLVKAFLAKFLGQKKTTRLRTELSTLRQLDDESLYEYWRRFKRLQRKCPYNGIQEWLLIQTLYNWLTYEYMIYIDAVLDSNFIEKVPTKAKALLEKMAANDNFQSGGRNSAKKGGKHDVDAMTLLTSNVQALSLKVDQLRAGPSVVASCKTCGVQEHIASECQYAEILMEQANALYNNNQQRRPYDTYSNTYNEGWKQNSAFSYKNTQNQLNPPLPRNNFNHPPDSSSNQAHGESDEPTCSTSGSIFKGSGHFPCNTEQPPKGQINVVTLRNGRELEDLPRKVVQKKTVAVEEVMVKDEKMIEKEKIEEKKKPNVIEPYKPLVPFPQRLAQAKLEKKYGKFLDILKKLPINIPFLDAISEMPSYAKFLKDMLSNKRKIEENATVSLTAECSAILQNKLQKKLGDPGSYSIPVKLGDIEIKKALYDLGASVSLMPLSICKKLQMGELKPTRISLQLANRSVRFPFGILEDVPLIVGKFFILCDFMVMEMEEDEQVLIIPGRPLLATA
ncbi:uncharacterized protein LOC125371220 [Ricinus communis]|uniref:uncharacterized protein LOC125371220 n=1 Tax=Ricinus communis TaxID=3988 RepID=UPI00201AC46B|nr:uncharacterized protein LOC125371220 [Ricinus communis]